MTTKIALLETIFLKTGIYISNKNDCRAISQLIQKEKIGYLSESTLYRLFPVFDTGTPKIKIRTT